MEAKHMIIYVITSALLSILLLPVYQKVLTHMGAFRRNYRDKWIPVSFGLYIFTIETLMLVLARDHLQFLLPFFLITLIGTYDDLYGETTIKGLSGHLQAFFRGRITSGFLKAVVGLILSTYLAFTLSVSFYEGLVRFFLILLMINMMNLFDLRPGRALKVFFLLFFILGILTFFFYQEPLGWILFSILLIVFFQDVRAKIMLGDSGANLIGMHLGIWYAVYFPLIGQVITLLLLIILHIYTERFSLSRWIDQIPLLRKIDLWGREGTE